MTTWKLLIEYDGTKYRGWQEQTNARTIMGELRAACSEVLGCEVELHGAGRTDAGVHAFGQVAHLRAERRREAGQLLRLVNDKLPAEIALLEAVEVPNQFHARHDATVRRYLYQIATRKSAFTKRYVWWIKQLLDLERMNLAAQSLAGRHDFVCFRAADHAKPDESTIVVVAEAHVEEEDGLILFRITASHFLWRMVRRLVGVLVKVGLHEVSLEQFAQLLAGQPDPALDVAAWTAPAAGLILEAVEYPAGKLAAKPAKSKRS